MPILSRIIDIVGHTVVSLSSPFPIFNYSHRLRKKQCPIFCYECPIFTRQKLNDKMSALNCPSFHRGETNVRSWVYNLFITIKRLYARDEKGAHPSLLWKNVGGEGRLFNGKMGQWMGLYVEMPNVGFQTLAVLERIAPVLCLKCDEMGIFLHI